MSFLLPRRAPSLALLRRHASSHATKHMSRRKPQRTLPDDKLRALISLYHQADTFITAENLSERIDAAFLSSSSLFKSHTTVADLQDHLKAQRASARIAEWEPAMTTDSEHHSASPSWSTAAKGRELRIRQELYGLSGEQKNVPGLEVVKDELAKDERVQKQLQNDVRDLLG